MAVAMNPMNDPKALETISLAEAFLIMESLSMLLASVMNGV